MAGSTAVELEIVCPNRSSGVAWAASAAGDVFHVAVDVDGEGVISDSAAVQGVGMGVFPKLLLAGVSASSAPSGSWILMGHIPVVGTVDPKRSTRSAESSLAAANIDGFAGGDVCVEVDVDGRIDIVAGPTFVQRLWCVGAFPEMPSIGVAALRAAAWSGVLQKGGLAAAVAYDRATKLFRWLDVCTDWFSSRSVARMSWSKASSMLPEAKWWRKVGMLLNFLLGCGFSQHLSKISKLHAREHVEQ